ncbi:MAG: hypothetical protein JWO81_3011 [Alphaproteobacteria bacterium]|nr:hypothetical protein [Alphaproteobacteria bacterium]
MAQDKDGMSGRDLQQSQSSGGSGRFGGNMEQDQKAGQAGGGPGPSDTSSAGGSSGTGGYGRSENVVQHQGQQARPGQASLAGGDASAEDSGSDNLSRGERFDEEQGGGRGPESVSQDDDEIAEDQRAHQDRGQSDVEFEREQS